MQQTSPFRRKPLSPEERVAVVEAFRLISWSSSFYSLLEEVLYSVGPMLSYAFYPKK